MVGRLLKTCEPVNTAGNEWYPAIAQDGEIYFGQTGTNRRFSRLICQRVSAPPKLALHVADYHHHSSARH